MKSTLTKTPALTYAVGPLRAAGLAARWGRTRLGAPCIWVRWPASPLPHQRDTWWLLERRMWAAMQRDGVLAGFESATLLGDVFAIPA